MSGSNVACVFIESSALHVSFVPAAPNGPNVLLLLGPTPAPTHPGLGSTAALPNAVNVS